MKTDGQLIEDYLDGNERALSTLVDRYMKDAQSFAYGLTNNAQAAEDITQEAFVKAWKHIRGYRQEKNFKTWLFTIVRNTAIDWLRKTKEIPFSTFENEQGKNMLADTLIDKQLSPDALIAQAEDAEIVRTMLTRLHPKYRDVLVLRHESDLTFREIGTILRRPLHTVKSQHRRALIALRRLMQAQTI